MEGPYFGLRKGLDPCGACRSGREKGAPIRPSAPEANVAFAPTGDFRPFCHTQVTLGSLTV